MQLLPTLDDGRVALDDAAAVRLETDPPDLVHLTAVASHRGVVQPRGDDRRSCAASWGCRWWSTPPRRWARSTARSGADATYSSSRKWIAGPRGVGVLAVRPT